MIASTANALAARLRTSGDRQPLLTFFALAYGGAWIVLLPLVLAQNGLGLLPITLPAGLCMALATLTGPALAAVVMTHLLQGRAGLRGLLHRYTQLQPGPGWYVLALCGPLAALLIYATLLLGREPLRALAQQWPALLVSYPSLLLMGLATGPVGEEVGWRGFALPRLQQRAGPVTGSLLLGVLWAAWHVPLFFLPAWRGAVSVPTVAAAYLSWVIPFTVIMTWLFNRTHGSLLIATLCHAALNATLSLLPRHLLLIPADAFLQAKLWGILALLLIVLTRGRLGHEPHTRAVPTHESPAPVPTPRRVGIQQAGAGLVVFVALAWVVANAAFIVFQSLR